MYLLSGDRQLNVIAPVHEHAASDDDDIRSKPQRSLDLANQNGFAVVNACFSDQTNLLVVGAMNRQADESRSISVAGDSCGACWAIACGTMATASEKSPARIVLSIGPLQFGNTVSLTTQRTVARSGILALVPTASATRVLAGGYILRCYGTLAPSCRGHFFCEA